MTRELSERALILAPRGRDAAVAAAMLAEAHIEAQPCGSLLQLTAELEGGVGLVVITEEALATADLAPISRWLDAQPEWSDLPFVLLTQRGGGLERNPTAARYLEILGNVTFLERPFHPTTLVSLAESALRGRRRQYEARARLEALHDSERRFRGMAASLQELNEGLTQRVEEAVASREMALLQLHEAQKLETIGQLTGGVAHDFNNLLSPITGALDLLSRRISPDDERSARLIDNALLSAERAKTLVQRLLGFARRQTLQTGAVEVGALLENMRDLIASSVGAQITLEFQIQAEAPCAVADPNQLELAILNLCVNARDAMAQGGRLTLATDLIELEANNSLGAQPGDYVRVSVVDTGRGMDAETLGRAIEPFYSTKEAGKGTGLGLSMVHGLAAQLGGAFHLESELGRGTRAELYLPATNDLAEKAPVETRGQPRSGPALRILLVDDEDVVRASTAEMLRDLGHEVIEAAGATQALALVAHGSAPDLVVTDYMMPHLSGATLADRLRARWPDLPVLIVTGYARGRLALDYPQLAKPFRQDDLQAAVHAAAHSAAPAH